MPDVFAGRFELIDPIWDVVADLTQPDPTTRLASAAEALAALALPG